MLWRGYYKILSPLLLIRNTEMKRIVILLFNLALCIFFAGCFKRIKKINTVDRDQMIKTDEAFSDSSKALGMKKAFIEFIDDDGILLRPNHLPIAGADAIDYLTELNDTSYTLTWKPLGAQASSSGDMGFTYGTYLLQLKDTALSGTYVNIWKKHFDGKWKFVLDSGNEGINSDSSSVK